MEATGASRCCYLASEGSPKDLYLQQINAQLVAAGVILAAKEPPTHPKHINSIGIQLFHLYRDICFIPEAVATLG